jgi:hypothetical protein
MTSDVCAQTPDDERRTTNDERPATTAYVERRLDDLRGAITSYVVDQTRELHEALNMLQALHADLSAQLEETAALVRRLEERAR